MAIDARSTPFLLSIANHQTEPDHAPASPVASNVARLNISDRQVQADYDWCDGRYDEYEQFDLAVVKRPRAEYSPTVGENASTRIGGGIRNLSRKFTGRKDKRFSSLPDSFHENVSRSRAGSMRAPSVAENRSSFDLNESRMPQALSVSSSYIEDGVPVEAPGSPIDVQEDDRQPDEEEVANEASRTPLLPPVMVSLKRETEPVQSPLQSPKIAESPTVAQKDPFDSPSAWNGLPSPPLSTKPSFSSFHHRPIVPPSEIPPMTLADPTDRWAINLGHANFTIYPEPYAPEPATAAGCKQLRTDWELARSNFAKHLAHTQAHYSTTSKTYQLTEQKWAEINSAWRHNHEEAVASVAHRSRQEAMEISHHGLLPDPEPAKLPSIHGLTSEGKFPKVGDVGIVGPMEVLRPAAQRPARKRNLWAFLQGMFPHKVSLGRSTSS